MNELVGNTDALRAINTDALREQLTFIDQEIVKR